MPDARRRSPLRTIQAGELLSAVRRQVPALSRAAAPRGGAPRSLRAAAAPAPGMSPEERRQLAATLVTLLQGLYAHLPQKRARYGADPVQRMRLLRDRSALLSEADFHAELGQIVTGLRDAHTRYREGSSAWAGKVAMLPFLPECYGPEEAPRYVVARVGPAKLVGDAAFVPGVELLSWNGMPFDRAVNRWADWETGGRPDARRARALQTLTCRSLEYGPPPDEDWVIVGYQPRRGAPREVRIPWRTVAPDVAPTSHRAPGAGKAAARSGSRAASLLAENPAAEAERRARQLLFAGETWEACRASAAGGGTRPPRARGRRAGELPSRMPDVLAARLRPTSRGTVGTLRIWSFSVADDQAFLAEVGRLLDQMSDTIGLVVDLRGNPGGLIWAAERALQLFTPRSIAPTRFSWLATDVTRAMAEVQPDLAPWAGSLREATSTGEPYSQPLPLTDPETCNDLGQRYGGPVLAVVDANTYSAGDLFAAGFVDNGVGPLLCVGKATGAGGANVWGSDLVRQALEGTPFAMPELPADIQLTLSVRRATRSGAAEGTPIEDLGIAGQPYAMSRADLLEDNRDLLERCAELLAGQPRSRLTAGLVGGQLAIDAAGLDTIDLFLDGHPWQSRPARELPWSLPVPGAPRAIEITGWSGGQLVQRRRLRPGA